MRKIQSGYTLVELSVALALAGLIVLGSVAGAMSLIDQKKINDLSTQNGDAIKRINGAYSQMPNYAGLTLRQAVSFGAFSQFNINNAGTNNVTVTHPFGGATGVASITNNSSLAWGLFLNAIPAQYCTELLFQSASIADALVVFPGGMDRRVRLVDNVTYPAILLADYPSIQQVEAEDREFSFIRPVVYALYERGDDGKLVSTLMGKLIHIRGGMELLESAPSLADYSIEEKQTALPYRLSRFHYTLRDKNQLLVAETISYNYHTATPDRSLGWTTFGCGPRGKGDDELDILMSLITSQR